MQKFSRVDLCDLTFVEEKNSFPPGVFQPGFTGAIVPARIFGFRRGKQLFHYSFFLILFFLFFLLLVPLLVFEIYSFKVRQKIYELC